MKTGWTPTELGDLYEIGSSKRVLKAQWKASGVPFYRGREVTRLAAEGSASLSTTGKPNWPDPAGVRTFCISCGQAEPGCGSLRTGGGGLGIRKGSVNQQRG